MQFSLSKRTSDSTRNEQYDYETNAEGTTRRGTFDNTDKTTNETVDQVNYRSLDGNLSYFHRSDSGGRGKLDSAGPFSESPVVNGQGGRTAEVNSTSEQEGFSGERSRYSNNWANSNGNGGDTRGLETSYSNRKGQSQADGEGSASVENDTVTQNGGEGSFNGQGRVSSGGTSFSENTGSTTDGSETTNTYTLNFSTGDGTGEAGGSGNTTSAGGGSGVRTSSVSSGGAEGASNDSGEASANTKSKSHGSGVSVDRTSTFGGLVTSINSVVSHGRFKGNGKGSSSGQIDPGNEVYDVSNGQDGKNSGRTTTTSREIGPDHSRFLETTGTSNTGGKNTFNGEVSDRGEAGDVTLNSDNDFGQYLKERENYNGNNGFLGWHTADGDRTNGTDLTAQGQVDHDAVPQPPEVSVTVDEATGETIISGGTYSSTYTQHDPDTGEATGDGESELKTYKRTLDHSPEKPSDTLELGTHKQSNEGDGWSTYDRESKSVQRTTYGDDQTVYFESVDTEIDSTTYTENTSSNTTQTIDDKSHWERTYTVEGDQRKLDIMSNREKEDFTRTDYDAWELATSALLNFEVPVDWQETTINVTESGSYHASHRVDDQGYAQGGFLTAMSSHTHSHAKEGGGGYSIATADSESTYTKSEETKELLDKSVTQRFSFELSSYHEDEHGMHVGGFSFGDSSSQVESRVEYVNRNTDHNEYYLNRYRIKSNKQETQGSYWSKQFDGTHETATKGTYSSLDYYQQDRQYTHNTPSGGYREYERANSDISGKQRKNVPDTPDSAVRTERFWGGNEFYADAPASAQNGPYTNPCGGNTHTWDCTDSYDPTNAEDVARVEAERRARQVPRGRTGASFDPPEGAWEGFVYGLGAGARGLGNGLSNAAANFVTIGGLLGDPDKNPFKSELNAYDQAIGVGFAEGIGTVLGEGIIAVGTGGLSAGSKAAKAVAIYDAVGNTYQAGSGAVDIYQNGANAQNLLQTAGGAIGLGGQAAGRLLNRSGKLDEVVEEAIDCAVGAAGARTHSTNSTGGAGAGSACDGVGGVVDAIAEGGDEFVESVVDVDQSRTLKEILANEPKLLEEARRQYKAAPEWQGIDPENTPVFYRPKAEVDAIRAKPGESGGHHPHGLALGGPRGQKLTPTGETRTYKNPLHSAATGLQRRIINVIKRDF